MILFMDKEEFLQKAQLQDGAVLLEDWDDFSGGIVGVTPDRCHVVYGYSELVASLTLAYIRGFLNNPSLFNECLNDHGTFTTEDAAQMAVEWIDYNTLGALCNVPESSRPIIDLESIEDEDERVEYIPIEDIMQTEGISAEEALAA